MLSFGGGTRQTRRERKMARISTYLAIAASVAAVGFAVIDTARAAPVTTDDLVKAQDNAGEWLMYGRDYRNWRYSPLGGDHAGQCRQADARLGDVDRRPVRRPRGDAALSATACSISPPTMRASSPSMREVRQHHLALRAQIRGRLHGHALLRPDPSRRRAEGRSGLSSRGSTRSWRRSTAPTARSSGKRRSTSGRTASPPTRRRWSSATTSSSACRAANMACAAI